MVRGDVKWCTVCANDGKTVELKTLQINFEEAIYLCPEKECTYPLGAPHVQTNVIRRNAKEFGRRKKHKSSKQKQTSAKHKSNIKLLSQLPSCLLTTTQPVIPRLIQGKTDNDSKSKPSESFAPWNPHKVPVSVDVKVGPSSVPKAFSVEDKSLKIENSRNAHDRNKGSNLTHRQTFLLWKNVDALCWLDASMCLIVHSLTLQNALLRLKTISIGMLTALLEKYNEAQVQFKNSLTARLGTGCNDEIGKTVGLETSVGSVAVKTGGGDPLDCLASFDDLETLGLTQPLGDNLLGLFGDVSSVKQCSKPDITQTNSCDDANNIEKEGKKMLSMLREDVWKSLQPKLKCEKGKNDSPVFALPLLLPSGTATNHLWWMKYCWQMTCTKCGHYHQDRVEKSLVTFPAVPEYFTMEAPCFLRKCFKCSEPEQKMLMKYDSLPDMIWVHFVEGLSSPTFSDYDFCHINQNYAVTGIVQYINSPDHFVAWLRNPVANTWLQYNDLESDVCQYTSSPPTFHPSQVHIMLWEKQAPNSGYARPIKSELFAQMYSKALVPESPEPPPILRCIMPEKEKTSPVSKRIPETISAKLSHLRPAEPKPAPNQFKLPASKPFRPMVAPVVNGDAGLQAGDRIQRMRAKFQKDRGIVSGTSFDTVTTQSRSLPISSASQTIVSQKPSISLSHSAGFNAQNTTTTPSFKSSKMNSLEVSKPGSYLAAIQPFLKRAAPAPSQKTTSQSNTFAGYVPKSKQLLEAKEMSKTSPVEISKSKKCVKKDTSPKKVSKAASSSPNRPTKTVPVKSVSFCDNDGFKVPTNPVVTKQVLQQTSNLGLKRKRSGMDATTNKIARPKFNLPNQPSSNVLFCDKSSMSRNQVMQRSASVPSSVGMYSPTTGDNSVTKAIYPRASWSPAVTAVSHQAQGVNQPSLVHGLQDQPLDLSPTRKLTQSPQSHGFDSMIDQLCSDLPSELANVPQQCTNSGAQAGTFSSMDLFGSDEQDVLKSLTDALVPDNYSSPTKSLTRSPMSKSYGEINLNSLFADL